jgi:predicted adenylyl cyclase CyaB
VGRNVEIKARLTQPDGVRRRVEALADGPPELLEQEDTFFACPEGRLKLRRFGDGAAELISYRREDTAGPRESRFCKAPVADADLLEAVLGAALGVLGRVRKRRLLYLAGPTRIHLDQVECLGWFLELEVVLGDDQTVADGEAIAHDLMAALGITEADLVDVAYVDLVKQEPNPVARP